MLPLRAPGLAGAGSGDVPEWDDAAPMTTDLAPFPGAQILIVLPARAPAPAPEPPARPGARTGNIRR